MDEFDGGGGDYLPEDVVSEERVGCCGGVRDTINCIVSLICCLCLAGPILMIIGGVFISSAFTDDRGQRIDEFKVSVDRWNTDALPAFQGLSDSDWTYSVENECASNGTAAVTNAMPKFSGAEDLRAEAQEKETFESYERVSFYDTQPPSITALDRSQLDCELDVSILFKGEIVGNLTTTALQEVSRSFRGLGCVETTRTETRNGVRRTIRNRNSDIASCRNRCQSQGGRASGDDYDNFNCLLLMKPAEVCVRVTPSGSSYRLATGSLADRTGASGSGCFYTGGGFGTSGSWEAVLKDSAQGVSQLEMKVRVRHERDPYLYFLDISDGTGNFGLTTGEKLRIGFGLLITGAIIQALVCCVCCCIVKFARSIASGNQKRPDNPVGGALYDVSSQYGQYIPGGAGAPPQGGKPQQGVPVQGVPTGPVQQPPPTPTYGSQPYGAQPYGAQPYGGAPAAAPPTGYSGDTSYDTPAYATPYNTGQNTGAAGAPPTGYPAV